MKSLPWLLLAACWTGSMGAMAAPVIDGSIGAGEGWTHLTESSYARPVTGGQSGTSDQIGETSTFHWWDSGAGGIDRGFGDNRGDIINIYAASDANYLYLGVAGPTLPFNSFDDSGGNGLEWDHDTGDLFIALDLSGGTASGNLSASAGHNGWGGARAVDFQGWTPNYVLGLQYVNNGAGGSGWADLERLSDSFAVGEGQNQNNGGLDWHATVSGGRAYDTHNGVAGEFEFRIAWNLLGLPGQPVGTPLRFNAYTTQNFAGSDAYDSAPGVGNNGPHEEIGDAPNDPDTDPNNSNYLPGAADLIAQPGGSLANSFPGADYDSGNLSAAPNHNDGIDTIGEYMSYTIVPEPSAVALWLFGGGALWIAHRRRRA